ncbi:MAG: carbohydrate kinase family protein [Chloroflexota bacterium]
MSIVLTGSIAYDYLMTFPGYFKDHIMPDRLDSISLSFLVDQMVRQRGGIAPNIAYTLALLGEKPLVFGTAGEDFEDYRQWLESHNIDTTYIRIIPGVFTASFFANTDLANNQICSFYTGAMAFARELSLEMLQSRPEMVVISPNDPVAMDRYVEECKQMQIPYVYDPSQQIARSNPEELRRGVDGAYSLFVNEYEWELLQKHTGFSGDFILHRVPLVVITRGAKGASIYWQANEVEVPAVPVEKIVDPTGVGDAFRGGFLRGWRLGFDFEICGKMGSLAAAYCLEQRGTQSHYFTIEDFIMRFRAHFDDGGKLEMMTQKTA